MLLCGSSAAGGAGGRARWTYRGFASAMTNSSSRMKRLSFGTPVAISAARVSAAVGAIARCDAV